MSSNALAMPKRSAIARALGRSVSQIARTSTVFSLRSVGRCATWTIAPLPMIPTLSGLLTRPPASVSPFQPRPRIVCRDDVLVAMAGPRAAHGSPLAEADAVPRPVPVHLEPGDLAAGVRHADRERGA